PSALALLFFVPRSCAPRAPHSFPTRRSSDLLVLDLGVGLEQLMRLDHAPEGVRGDALALEYASLDAGSVNGGHVLRAAEAAAHLDRKSTRLNSSHVKISYAVFCLKKKNTHEQ